MFIGNCKGKGKDHLGNLKEVGCEVSSGSVAESSERDSFGLHKMPGIS